MIAIDQNSALNSINESLVPAPHLIDGRKEHDWLHFLAEFSRLINFYNDQNAIEGSWNPFLLKDPVFLVVSISKTNYKKLHSQYKTNCNEVQKLNQTKAAANQTSTALNKLFDHLTETYKIIERWTYYMQMTDEMYNLKKYMLHEVQNMLSADFWAVQSFRQYLYTQSLNAGFAGLPSNTYVDINDDLWNSNKGKRPFWEVFGFDTEQVFLETGNKNAASLNALTITGDRLYNFLETTIFHALTEFKNLSNRKSRYPDTTLLRSFIDLLKVQQEQLNGISQKHLDFYYSDILKQTNLPASADTAFLSATLSQSDSVYVLPAGTLFNGGVDAQKNPILFAAQKNSVLNPAIVTSAYTLNYQNLLNGAYNLQPIAKPTAIQKDEDGNVISWSTFGENNPAIQALPLGIAFASPMLLLREGDRTITLDLSFDAPISLSLLQNAQYFLSTQKEWLPIVLTPSNFVVSGGNTVTITIKIDPSTIAIEPFLVNPDGLTTSWPMLKILFKNIDNPKVSPKVTAITISVKVTDVTTLQLYNDFGELNTKNPFPPFGPIALENSNFIIGSSEIFSKPLNNFSIHIYWDKLPTDFSTYYDSYNRYLSKLVPQPIPPKGPPTTKPITEPNPTASRIPLIRLFSKKTASENVNLYFANYSFTVDFDLLENKSWNEIELYKYDYTGPNCVFVPTTPAVNPVYLFDVDQEKNAEASTTDSSSHYIYIAPQGNTNTVLKGDPNIQNEPLKFTDGSSSGFIKMLLSGPEYGFGSEIYPNVVASIALQNGSLIATAKKDDTLDFIPSANPPFSPKIKTIKADYSASKTYKFDNSAEDYPLEYFLYSPFSSYKIYDSDAQATVSINTAITGTSNDTSGGVPLYPSFEYSGALFIEMEQLICNSTLNLYLELSRNSITVTPENSIQYFYLNDYGWKELKVLSDGTNQFRCSGIIELSIPADCNNTGVFMPGKNNWISIVVSGSPDAYSQTVFVQTNGFSVQRTGTSFLLDTTIPQVGSSVISKPQTAIPKLAVISQPFPSFGGKAAENDTQRNQRISSSIKTKNRAANPADFYTLITENFSDIYYTKVVNHNKSNTCKVYLAKKMSVATDSNAFIPLVNNCLEDQVEAFLKENASPFLNLNVSNFNLEYVIVSVQIEVLNGYQPTLVQKNVNQALKIYLSPWIESSQRQVKIGHELINAKVSSFIQSIEGVGIVNNLSFSSYLNNSKADKCIINRTSLKAEGSGTLLVSAPQHHITFSN
ncbi:baseplate J/gp47 family protein [Flavobacterium endoglycinae]|uniref:Baseplate J/gp47 family protein n=1 Tax=Flavobacterium endoglycinae TaxID=2816357 RepID=A0ABX7QFV4_9FLAO|nr:baseplate J/gp47 family protein [Flavobacterium endoglycinae]QSW89348.1 baseplate J/gp47 family protein [Flavobacterium endoglycinae]